LRFSSEADVWTMTLDVCLGLVCIVTFEIVGAGIESVPVLTYSTVSVDASTFTSLIVCTAAGIMIHDEPGPTFGHPLATIHAECDVF
jgi:hypothetical protein